MALLETFTDDFNSGSLDATKWSNWGGSNVAVVSNELKLSIPASNPAGTYFGLDCIGGFDLTGSHAFMRTVDAGNTAIASFDRGWQLFKDANNALTWTLFAGTLQAKHKVGGTYTVLASTAYSSTTHMWLRIREASGTIYWDYSKNGVTWTNLFSEANPFVINAVSIDIFAGTDSNETLATAIIFDNLNVLPVTPTVTVDGAADLTLTPRHQIRSSATVDGAADISVISNKTALGLFDAAADMSVIGTIDPINAYGTQPTTFSVLINGVERVGDVVAGSLSIDDLLYDQANIAQFNMEILSGLAAPDTDQTIEVWLDGELQFGGLIDIVKSTRNGGQFDTFEIDCVDYTRLLDRRLVNQTFNNMLDTDIAAAIINNYAPDEGITTNSISAAGVMVSQISWNYISPSQALSDLAKLTGRFWYLDYAKDLHYFPLTQNQAVFDIDDNSNVFSNLQTTKDASQIRNRVFVQGGTELSDPFTESQKSDGVKTIFLLAEHPHNISMTVNGTAKTIGIENIDDPTTVNFLVNYEEKYIKVGNATTPANGDTLAFTYQYDVPVLVSIEDTASIASDGVYEFPIIDNTITTTNAARDRATAELTDYAQKLVSVSYDTMVRKLRSGMYQNVTLTPQGIAGDYIITEVKLQSISGGLFQASVTLTSAKVLGIIKFLIDMLNITHTVGTFDPNATVDGFSGIFDSLNPLSDSLVDSLSAGNSSAKWSNDPGTTTFKLKWNLGQWQ